MRKKFISAMLFGVMITASTSTFVSCKDYDDDITELRNAIAANETDLASLINGKLKTAEEEIARLQAQSETLSDAYKKADEGLQAAIANAEKNANAYADIQRAEAEKAAIEAARKMVDEAVAGLQASIDAANAKIEEQGNSIKALIEADAELSKGIEAAKARANEAYELADKANKLADEANKLAGENAAKIEELKSTLNEIVTNLSTVKANLEEQISLLQGNVKDLLTKAEEQSTKIASLEEQLKSLSASNETAIKALQDKDAELAKKIEDNNKAVNDRLDTEVADLKKLAADNLKEAKAYTDAEILKVSNDIKNINTKISDIEKAYKQADADLKKELQGLINDLQKQLDNLKTAQANTDKEQDRRIKELEDLLKALENGNVQAFAQKVQGMDSSISTLQQAVETINANLAYESKRLKSLVYAPTTYVDGIECIQFATLQYKDWGTAAANWEADAAKTGNKTYVIDDAEQKEEYLVNPKNVNKNDIVSLAFVSNTASNTRAFSTSAPIAVNKYDIENGVMKLDIKKTVSTSFGTNRDKFTIVALKATLADKFLTEEQIKNGEKAEVYSDWARLYETSETPYIHNKLAHDAAGKVVESYNGSADSAHFWNYSSAYNNATKATALPQEYNYRHIVKDVYYEDDIDLLSLVEVCDTKGHLYDTEKYGLAFEFHVMDYKLKNLNETSDATNQKSFAKLKEDGHTLVSTARDNTTTKNRDAIGRQPMIQVILKDVRDPKSVKVIDVRYFKIQWIDKIDVKSYGELDNFTKKYGCGNEYDLQILEEKVNAVYTKYNMSRSEFHNAYTLCTDLFASEAAAKAGKPASAKLGTIEDQADFADPGQTHNFQWTISEADNKLTQAEYAAGKKVITAYGYFQSKANPNNKIIFSVTLTLTVDKMAYASGMGKDQTMWKNGARFVNPQLESDANYGTAGGFATTQILGNFLKGYIKGGKTPSTIEELVNYYDKVEFVFDESKLADLATATKTQKSDWTISADGLTLLYKRTAAAVISGSDIYLYETEIGGKRGQKASEPSEGAKLLVGHYAPVKLADEWCSLTETIDRYNVEFITPLQLTANTMTVTLTDITAGGSNSAASLAGTVEIKEMFTTNKRIVYDNKASGSKTNTALVAWYGVVEPNFQIAKAKTNIQTNGTIGSACNVLLSEIRNADGTQKYDVSITGTGANTKVVFKNMSGNAIGHQFKVEIPVYIKTKWQELTATLTVTVKPNI